MLRIFNINDTHYYQTTLHDTAKIKDTHQNSSLIPAIKNVLAIKNSAIDTEMAPPTVTLPLMTSFSQDSLVDNQGQLRLISSLKTRVNDAETAFKTRKNHYHHQLEKLKIEFTEKIAEWETIITTINNNIGKMGGRVCLLGTELLPAKLDRKIINPKTGETIATNQLLTLTRKEVKTLEEKYHWQQKQLHQEHIGLTQEARHSLANINDKLTSFAIARRSDSTSSPTPPLKFIDHFKILSSVE